MMSNSERAMARRPSTDRDELREMWRLAAVAAAVADDAASRAKDGRSIFFDEVVTGLLEADQHLTQARAERMARTSDAYKQYVQKMHDLAHEAAKARIQCEDLNRRYWEQVGREADSRAERRMG